MRNVYLLSFLPPGVAKEEVEKGRPEIVALSEPYIIHRVPTIAESADYSTPKGPPSTHYCPDNCNPGEESWPDVSTIKL